ncbi:LAQU0S13e02432g1_1 [Lachancea quebecensis]|uniref:LAQU0S13e02432g1_1 n=1 Tax=Lachancea quebecensis TaxID=1654605 RepID=A0A0N7MM44_9SACH|nr:LAQU0S13e02432g1_1 [Lachancea quebecensis]
MLEPAALVKNLQNFRLQSALPLASVWPSNRRAATLVLLFIGNRGELRVLLTKRCRNLRSFSGHVSLPGGKSDSPSETAEVIARRESEEEISLPSDDLVLHEKYKMTIEKVSSNAPHYLARTFLSVKPIIYFLYNSATPKNERYRRPLDGAKFFGKLNPGETSSLFSIPLNDFIVHQRKGTQYKVEYVNRKEYKRKWGGLTWRIEHYYYPNTNPGDAEWLNDILDTSSGDEDQEGIPCKDVWGLTAKILHDICCIAHGKATGQESVGHEGLIYGLHEFGGQMRERSRSDWENQMLINQRSVKFEDVIPSFQLEPIVRQAHEF